MRVSHWHHRQRVLKDRLPAPSELLEWGELGHFCPLRIGKEDTLLIKDMDVRVSDWKNLKWIEGAYSAQASLRPGSRCSPF
jgi:hypothetical protein